MKFPKDHYSYSSFAKFETCPRCWWYYYVKYAETVEPDSYALILGNAYHSALEAMYKGRPKSECLEVFDAIARGKAYTSLVQRDYQVIREAVEYYYSAIYPLYKGRVDGVELGGKIKFPGLELPFKFKIDLATKDGVIVDHKTVGKVTPKVAQNAQLCLYSYAYMLDTGKLPRAVEIHSARKYTGRERVEVQTWSPTLVDVLRVLSRFRSFVKRVEINDFPSNCGSYCQYHKWGEEHEQLLIKSGGDPSVI